MYISHSFARHLGERDVDFDVLTHPPTATAEASARKLGLPRDQVAKGVLLRAGERYILAVIPASRTVNPRGLESVLHVSGLELADEDELAVLFSDCSLGAIPPVGAAYGVDTVVDDSLMSLNDVYLEAGDHEHLVHVNHAGFERLMEGARIASGAYISRPLLH